MKSSRFLRGLSSEAPRRHGGLRLGRLRCFDLGRVGGGTADRCFVTCSSPQLNLRGLAALRKLQIVRYPDGNVVHYVSTLYACGILAGSLQTCDETLDLNFFDPAHLPDDLLSMHRIRIQDAMANSPAAFIR